jgi:hypothetical protein
MARIPDAFIDDRAAMARACESPQRAPARWLNPLAAIASLADMQS